MSRTTLCVVTASLLAVASLSMMALRSYVLGEEVRRPIGPGTWKVRLSVQGCSQGRARLWTPTPLDMDRQHLVEENFHSEELTHKMPDGRYPDRRRVIWVQRTASPTGQVRTRSEFLVSLNMRRAAGGSSMAASGLYAAPQAGDYLGTESLIETSDDRITDVARELTSHLEGSTSQLDTAQALFHFVEERIPNEPHLDGSPMSALTCLETRSGDRSARCRLLVALLRNRNIPARMVSGLTLNKGAEQAGHYWVEAYVYDHWMPMCPYYRLFGRVPSTFLIFGFGDRPIVSARNVTDLKYAFIVERLGKANTGPIEESSWRRAFKSISLYQLPPGDRRLVEVLLLMPIAALIVCFFRNVIGLHSFGTFTPALIGLAFHDLNSWPGLIVFISILLIGWLMRRILDRFHLLQVPRIATMLTLIMSLLICLIVLSNQYGTTTTRYISLFPIVILTGMVERFWTLENEDSTFASFKTLLQTMMMAMTIALILSRPFVVQQLFCYPETLGLVMAGQLLIGRYTGYRLMELFRFQDFLQDPPQGYTTQAA